MPASKPRRFLPYLPNLEHLQNQSKKFLGDYHSGDDSIRTCIRKSAPKFFQVLQQDSKRAQDFNLADAKFVLAKEYGFENWVALERKVESLGSEKDRRIATLEGLKLLESAIHEENQGEITKAIRTFPELLEKRFVEWSDRLHPSVPHNAIAYATGHGKIESMKKLIELGADVRAYNHRPISFASEKGNIAALDVLVAHYDVSSDFFHKWFENACIQHRPEAISWFIKKGVNPNKKFGKERMGIDIAICSHVRTNRLQPTIDALISGGAYFTDGPVADLLRGKVKSLRERLVQNPEAIHQYIDIGDQRPYREYYTGRYGGAPLKGATLLHVCAEFNFVTEAQLLINLRANINARANPALNAGSDQTPIFHSVASNYNISYPVLQVLTEKGADLSMRATIQVPEHEYPIKDVTPLSYAYKYPHPLYDENGKMNNAGVAHDSVIELANFHLPKTNLTKT